MNEKYNILNNVYGYLTVKEFSYQNDKSQYFWLCECKCGNTKVVRATALRAGWTKSCGCLKGEIKTINSKHKWKKDSKFGQSFFYRIQSDAKRRKLDFELTLEQCQNLFDAQNGKCALSGVDIDFGLGCMDSDRTASLDRIDSTKGYIISNVQWIHKDINFMKHSLDEKRFLELVDIIHKYQNKNTEMVLLQSAVSNKNTE